MSRDTDQGIAYLMALRESAASPEPQQETGGAAAPGGSFAGVEKRRSPRYKCEGSAEMREDGCDVRTWATFSDIGLHGCYVEVQATYPVGTLLHMKLDSNGIHVETRGRVRVTYPYLGMGIAFTEMSEENSAALRRMLAGISRPGITMGPVSSALPLDKRKTTPDISDPSAALQALAQFFENRQMMTREDFVKLLRRSQNKP